jgi:peptidyl-prolyl cis-trans isomerase A (cyclophilin A)
MRNRWRTTLLPPPFLLTLFFCLLASTVVWTPTFALRASAGLALQAAGPAPQGVSRVRLETTKGEVILEVTRAWAPHGADRFLDLVRAHYYDDCRLFRVIKDRWAQFGIAGDPAVAEAWRTRTIPDDPFVQQSNVRGTIAFAFAVPNGRTTQVFINTGNNSATHDKEPFVPFGRVIQGLDVVDAWYSAYAETSGGGIRAGHQDAAFAGGNAFFDREFPKLDRITRATALER